MSRKIYIKKYKRGNIAQKKIYIKYKIGNNGNKKNIKKNLGNRIVGQT